MTYVDIGVTGAKRVSIEGANTRHLLISIMERYPLYSDVKLLKRYMEAVKDDPDMLDVVIKYKFANDYAAIAKSKPTQRKPNPNALTTTAITERMRGALNKHIKEKAEQMLMDMPMPNGKRLGDCTISYCARLGGWMARIAKGKNPRQMVSFVYTEEDLKHLRKG